MTFVVLLNLKFPISIGAIIHIDSCAITFACVVPLYSVCVDVVDDVVCV